MRRLGILGGAVVWLASVGCGPSSSMAGGETEGDTETGSSSGTGDSTDPPNPTTPDPTNASNNSDSDPTVGPDDSTTSGVPPMATTADDGDTEDPDTGECPIGADGCPCDVGAVCDEGLECALDTGICVAPPDCVPIDTDPHADEASATAVVDLDCDSTDDLGLIGTIAGIETDWYTFSGNDAGFCPEQPGAIVTASEPLAVCVYIECANGGDASPNCAGAAVDATSPDGRPGCCGESEAVFDGYDCSGFGGKDVDVYVSVGSDADVCVDYEMSIQF